MKNANEVILIFMIIIALGLACFLTKKNSIKDGKEELRLEAVKVGVAKWDSNANGTPKFVWITNSIPNTLTE